MTIAGKCDTLEYKSSVFFLDRHMKIIVREAKDIANKREGVMQVLYCKRDIAPRVRIEDKKMFLEMGIGEEALSRHAWMRMIRKTIRSAHMHKAKVLVIEWKNVAREDCDVQEYAQILAENIEIAAYSFRAYKKKPKEGWGDVQEVQIIAPKDMRAKITRGIRKGRIIADAVNFSRDLSNMPGADMTPAILVQKVRRAIRGHNIKMRVLTQKQMRAKKMEGVLAVGRGSIHTPRFIVLEYYGAMKRSTNPVVLVGKGVTFDSGGIDVKPYPAATDMMMDMSGGAAVIASVIASARLKQKRNIVALVPAVENMISGSSFRPGDVLKMMNGTTVEVRNTDAEGRLILADALTYAQKFYTPQYIVDVATLTGASLVALGQQASAVLSRDEDFATQIHAYGEQCGDRAWPLPLWEEYDAMMRSAVADIANIAKPGQDRFAGTITAASFLKKFVDASVQWAHIDMAPRMTAAQGDELASGSTGEPVRLLMRIIDCYDKKSV